ncbi:hypothetical protein RvY_16852 [Ramazzottius varieornatus]|uniref:SUEL-type lectin domain-containing protein n=1 Tax=Ramazzottius varieornatus TaxID=947166 RepID=A0A1D1W677_RAMVA|nr:hypothetical protein RvY_16852 [Ramazzottius varieornatus]
MLYLAWPTSNLIWIFAILTAQGALMASAQQPIQSSTVMEVALAPENSILTMTCPQTCSLRIYDATYKELCQLGSDADCASTCPTALNAIPMVRNTCAKQSASQCLIEVSSNTLRRPCGPQQARVVHLVVSYRCEDCASDNTEPFKVAVEQVNAVSSLMAGGGSGGSSFFGAGQPTLTLGASGTVRSFCDLSQLAFVRALCNSNGKLVLP